MPKHDLGPPKRDEKAPSAAMSRRAAVVTSQMTQDEMRDFVSRWTVIRDKGRLRYIALRGFLGVGVSLMLIIGVIIPLSRNSFDFSMLFDETYRALFAWIMICCYVAGYLIGQWLWSFQEAKYAICYKEHPYIYTPWDDPALLKSDQPRIDTAKRPVNKKKRKS